MSESFLYPDRFSVKPIVDINLNNLFIDPSRQPHIPVPEDIHKAATVVLAGQGQVPLMVMLQLYLEQIELRWDRIEGRKVPHLIWRCVVYPPGVCGLVTRMSSGDTAGPRMMIKRLLDDLRTLPVGRGARIIGVAGIREDYENELDFVDFDWSSLDGLKRQAEHNLVLARGQWWPFDSLILRHWPHLVRGAAQIPDEVDGLDTWHGEHFEHVCRAAKTRFKPALDSLLHALLRDPKITTKVQERNIPVGQFAFTRLGTALYPGSLKSARMYTRLL